jgi:Ca-activated chloride channel family protein
MKNFLLMLAGLLAPAFFCAQNPTVLTGKITALNTYGTAPMETLMGATVKLWRGGEVVKVAITQQDGTYRMQADSGTYDVEVIIVGYVTQKITNVHVLEGQENVLDCVLNDLNTLEEVLITDFKVPFIQRDYTTSTSTLSSDSINGSGKKAKKKGKSRHVKVRKQQAPRNTQLVERDTSRQEGSPENYARIVENDYLETTSNPVSTFSIDVDGAAYANARRFLNLGQLPPRDAVRVEEFINYFDYQYELPSDGTPFAVHTELAKCPWNTEHHLLSINLQGRQMDAGQLPPSNFVFLVDVSGSMQDDNKLPLVQSSLSMLVDFLRPQDRVALVAYAGNAGLVLPSTSGTEKNMIKTAIDALNAGGSTAGGEGIVLAYQTARNNFIEGGNNRIVLCTDGDFNVGVSSDAELIQLIEKERKSDIFLSILGFGMGNYQDSKMQQLADKGNGNHSYIDQLSEARKVLISEFGGTLFTIAKDVKLQIQFNPRKVAAYRLLGYENRMLKSEDFDDDTKDAGELGAGHRVTALYEIIPAGRNIPAASVNEDLVYPKIKPTKAALSNDLLTLKLRYKQPKWAASSKLIKIRIPERPAGNMSENLTLAAAAASFGMLLRHSAYKGDATYESALALAQAASQNDRLGYRTELCRLIRTANTLR